MQSSFHQMASNISYPLFSSKCLFVPTSIVIRLPFEGEDLLADYNSRNPTTSYPALYAMEKGLPTNFVTTPWFFPEDPGNLHSAPDYQIFTFLTETCSLCKQSLALSTKRETIALGVEVLSRTRYHYALPFIHDTDVMLLLEAVDTLKQLPPRQREDSSHAYTEIAYHENFHFDVFGDPRGCKDSWVDLCDDCTFELLEPVKHEKVMEYKKNFTDYLAVLNKHLVGTIYRDTSYRLGYTLMSCLQQYPCTNNPVPCYAIDKVVAKQKVKDSYKELQGTLFRSRTMKKALTSPGIDLSPEDEGMGQSYEPRTVPCEDTHSPWLVEPDQLEEFVNELAAMTE